MTCAGKKMADHFYRGKASIYYIVLPRYALNLLLIFTVSNAANNPSISNTIQVKN